MGDKNTTLKEVEMVKEKSIKLIKKWKKF
jgi:hypothetical protein